MEVGVADSERGGDGGGSHREAAVEGAVRVSWDVCGRRGSGEAGVEENRVEKPFFKKICN